MVHAFKADCAVEGNCSPLGLCFSTHLWQLHSRVMRSKSMLIMKNACAFIFFLSPPHERKSKDDEESSNPVIPVSKYIWSLYLQRARANGRLPKK